MTQLALYGGTPHRSRPFPARRPFSEESVALAVEAIRSQNLFGPSGRFVPALEREFAVLYGAQHAVACSSGTAAIHIALGTLNPNPGDEVITTPITDAGGIVPILFENCVPVFADVDATGNLDPADVERQITPRTAAIIAVHLAGNACQIEALAEIARRQRIALIEDCSQAHVTRYRDRYLGTYGDIAVFSLQQSKHMTAGDGGVVITNRADWAERMRLFGDKGWLRGPRGGRRSYAVLGLNYRMTELQAAVALPQIKTVRAAVERRIELGAQLASRIRDLPGLQPPPVTEGSEHACWMVPLRVERWTAARFAEALTAEGVPAGAGYIGEPIYLCMEALAGRRTFGASAHPLDGCHGGRQFAYAPGLCPRAEDLLRHMVTLTIHEHYTRDDIEDIAGAIRKVATHLPSHL